MPSSKCHIITYREFSHWLMDHRYEHAEYANEPEKMRRWYSAYDYTDEYADQEVDAYIIVRTDSRPEPFYARELLIEEN